MSNQLGNLIWRLRHKFIKAHKKGDCKIKILPTDIRDWSYFPVLMPVDERGAGPAEIGTSVTVATLRQYGSVAICYEVWDKNNYNFGVFNHLYDAINRAMELTLKDLNTD